VFCLVVASRGPFEQPAGVLLMVSADLPELLPRLLRK